MIAEIYEAFMDAGVTEEKAKAAAKAVAEYDNRFNKVDNELAIIKAEIISAKSEVVVIKWLVGISIALTISILSLLLKQAL
jgi:hypothetical protein